MASMRHRLAVIESMLQDQKNRDQTAATEATDGGIVDGRIHEDLSQQQHGSRSADQESLSIYSNYNRIPPPSAIEEELLSSSKAAMENESFLSNPLKNHPRRTDSFNTSDRASRSAIDPFDSDSDDVTETTLDLVPTILQEQLLHLFWTRYSSTFPFIDKDLFLRARNEKDPSYFSKVLEMCMLMTGLRFAACTSSELQQPQLTTRLGPRKLYRATKRLIDKELELRTDLPIIQALILMAEAESNFGRHNTGWMYLGMAFRLALRIGLDRDSTYVGLPPKEAAVRHWTLYTCLMFERFWPLVLMRSSGVINFDVQLLNCALKSVEMSHERHLTPSDIAQQYTSLSLSELSVMSRALQGLGGHRGSTGAPNDYFVAIAVGAELQALHNRLPERTKWSSVNAQTATSFYFLFHQHYYVTLILLHWPFAHFRPFSLRDGYTQSQPAFQPEIDPPDHMQQVSRMICFTHAMSLTNMCKQHHARHNAREMVFVAVGHAEVAATALLMCLTHTQDPKKRNEAKAYLLDIIDIFKALAQTYDIARQLLGSLERSLSQWHNESVVANVSSSPAGTRPTPSQILPTSTGPFNSAVCEQQIVSDGQQPTPKRSAALELEHPWPSALTNNSVPNPEWVKRQTRRSPPTNAADNVDMSSTSLTLGQQNSSMDDRPRGVSHPQEPPRSSASDDMCTSGPISLCLTPSSRLGSSKDWPLYLSPNSMYGEINISLDPEIFFDF